HYPLRSPGRIQTGVIPGLRQRKGAKYFFTSPPALETQDLAGIRSISIPPAATTPGLARERWSSTARIPIRPAAQRRFCSTAPAHRIAPMEPMRLSITDLA